MGKCVVLVQDPQFVFPQLWLFLMNSLLLCYQNFQTVSLVYSVTLWNPFSYHNAVDVKKKFSITLYLDFDILAFFYSWWCRRFPVFGLPISFNIVLEYLGFMASNNVSHQFRDSGSSCNLSRKSEQICWRTGFWSGVKFFGNTLRRHSSCAIARVKFFWQFLCQCLES